MGYIRFLLAALVVASHCHASTWTIGSIGAVDAFFLISGFYMALTYSKNYDGANRAVSFFASRYLRLYPMYLTLVLLTALVWWIGRGSIAAAVLGIVGVIIALVAVIALGSLFGSF